ncbi:DUF4232 domain-containing protein [Streptomyces sp. NPDC101249]|uniref:DUF4232 domain-containing protein n=1 Tax=Streptomyces sp. NPDC101249 TaxID=3366140 RepID=UPI0037FC639A
MSSIRTSRTRLLAAAATVVLAGLSLTACSDGTGVHDEGASKVSGGPAGTSPRPSADASGGPDATAGQDRTPDGKTDGQPDGKRGGSAGSGSGSSGAESASLTERPVAEAPAKVTCEGSTTKTVATPLTRPLNHLLLKVTNTGGKRCYLYHYPAVRFGQEQAVPPVVEESRPQAVVTLEPGQSGYASVLLSAADGSGGHGYTSHSLDVAFFGAELAGSVGKGAHPALPAKGVYVDESLKVTYWQQDMDDAVQW